MDEALGAAPAAEEDVRACSHGGRARGDVGDAIAIDVATSRDRRTEPGPGLRAAESGEGRRRLRA